MWASFFSPSSKRLLCIAGLFGEGAGLSCIAWPFLCCACNRWLVAQSYTGLSSGCSRIGGAACDRHPGMPSRTLHQQGKNRCSSPFSLLLLISVPVLDSCGSSGEHSKLGPSPVSSSKLHYPLINKLYLKPPGYLA